MTPTQLGEVIFEFINANDLQARSVFANRRAVELLRLPSSASAGGPFTVFRGDQPIPAEGAIVEAVETAKEFCGADAPGRRPPRPLLSLPMFPPTSRKAPHQESPR